MKYIRTPSLLRSFPRSPILPLVAVLASVALALTTVASIVSLNVASATVPAAASVPATVLYSSTVRHTSGISSAPSILGQPAEPTTLPAAHSPMPPATTTTTTITATTTTSTAATATTTSPTSPTTVPTTTTTTVTPATTTTRPKATTTGARATTAPVVARTLIPADCSTDVSTSLSAYLDAMPPGSVFSSPPSACYLVNEGLTITHSLTLIGGVFDDESSVRTPSGPGRHRPIIQILDASYVTVSDITVVGANAEGNFNPLLVDLAGVKVLSSSHVTLNNIKVMNTFGDGLELVADLGHQIYTADRYLTVNGFTTRNAGRQGITFAAVKNATLTNVHVYSPAADGFDFESDVQGQGSGNVAITDCSFQHGLNVVESLMGPVSLTRCTGASWVAVQGSPFNQPVTFTDSSLKCENRAPIPCISVRGATVTFNRMTVSRHRLYNEVMTEPAWYVSRGGHLTMIDTMVTGPTGSNSIGSTVTIHP